MTPNALKFLRRLRFLSDKRRLELYPPFWLMRVKVLELSPDWRRLHLLLPLNMFSRNMGNCMFGGYQAAVSDPIAALACARVFPGSDVWTRQHEVDFQHVGNSDLELRFEFDPDQEQQIRDELAARGRSNPTFEYWYYRKDGMACTRIRSRVAIRPAGYLNNKKQSDGIVEEDINK